MRRSSRSAAQTLVPGSQIGRFLVRLGLIAGGDRRRLLPGLFQQGVRLRLRVGIQPLDNGINSVHQLNPLSYRDQALILMIISMEASRDRMA